MVPESHGLETLRSKPSIARSVISTFGVLGSIALHDDAMFETDEVHDEVADGNLTTPFRLREPSITQKTPERFLCVCRLDAQRASA
jgi:hypothetical protein